MASKKSIGATLVLNNGNFYTNLRNASKATQGFKSTLQGLIGQTAKSEVSFGSVAKKIVGVTAAALSIGAIKSFGKQCLDSANNATNAMTRLNTIMQQIPGNTQAMTDSVSQYAGSLSKTTSIGGSAQRYGASQLASFKMSAETIKLLLPQLDNLAVAQYGVNVSGDQMIAAANMMGKAFSGQTGAMTRAGVVMTEQQKKIIQTGSESQKAAAMVEVLQQNFGNLAEEMAKTPTGALQRLKNQIGGIKVKIGQELQPIVVSAINFAADRLPAVADKISGVIGKINDLFAYCKPEIQNVKNALSTAADQIGNAFNGVQAGGAAELAKNILPQIINSAAKIIEFAGKIISGIVTYLPQFLPELKVVAIAIISIKAAIAATNVVIGIMNAIAAVNPFTWIAAAVVGIVLLYRHCEGFRNIVNAVWSGIKAFGSGCVEVFKKIGGFIGSIPGKAKDVISERLAGMKQAYEEHGGGVKGFFAGWWESIKGYYTAGFSFIDKLTGGKLTAIKDKFVEIGTGVLDHIKGVINKITGAINILIRGINKVKFDLPDWVPGGPKTLGFNIPEIPQLAKGGIIRRPGTVMVGERGPEYLNLPTGAQVTPLEKANNNENVFNIYINGVNKTVDEILDDLVPRLKLALSNL